MGMSKTEVNLKRLLVTAPQQQNQAKLIHVCTGHSSSTLYRELMVAFAYFSFHSSVLGFALCETCRKHGEFIS